MFTKEDYIKHEEKSWDVRKDCCSDLSQPTCYHHKSVHSNKCSEGYNLFDFALHLMYSGNRYQDDPDMDEDGYDSYSGSFIKEKLNESNVLICQKCYNRLK